MKQIGIAAIAAVLLLTACGSPANTSTTKVSPAEAPKVQAPSFKSAGLLIRWLQRRGVPCKPVVHPGVGTHPGLDAMPSGPLPAACLLPSGDRVTVLIVKNGARTYQRQFATRHTPQRVLYGPNWVAILPKSVPPPLLDKIRGTFREGL